MKRIISLVLVAVMLCVNVCNEAFASNTNKEYECSDADKKLMNYLKDENPKYLIQRNNYCYMNFVEEFEKDPLLLYLLEMTNKLIHTKSEVDVPKYMEVLINIIGTYELDNAADIAEQHKMDYLKDYKDYALDLVEIGTKSISVMTQENSGISKLKSKISTAVEGLSVLATNTNNWIEALSSLETVIQNYSAYDVFLEVVEKRADGNLKIAASRLRDGMHKAILLKLSTYTSVTEENFKKYEEFFFTNMFLDIARKTDLYGSDENFRVLVDCGDEFMGVKSYLQDSWDLGLAIGKLVGNITVNGEDLINRLLETMAIYDISEILQEELLELESEFLNNYGQKCQMDVINRYITYSQYLIGCRIRGEYCIYSIIANDAGLLSKFGVESGKEAEEWYKNKSRKMIILQRTLPELSYMQITDKETIISTEEKNFVWMDFLASEQYSAYTEEWDNISLEYVIADINGDKVSELLIQATEDGTFHNTWIFVLNDDEIVLANETYGYGSFRYSPSNNAVIGTPEVKTFSGMGYSPFYRLYDTQLQYLFQIEMNKGRYYYSDKNGENEYSEYFEDAYDFDWCSIQTLPSIDSNSKNKAENLYEYIENTLVPQYGVMNTEEKQEEINQDKSHCSNWSEGDLTGLLSATVGDFDNDGQEELLAISWKAVSKGFDDVGNYYSDQSLQFEVFEFSRKENAVKRSASKTIELTNSTFMENFGSTNQVVCFAYQYDGCVYLAVDNYFEFNESVATLDIFQYDGNDIVFVKAIGYQVQGNGYIGVWKADKEPKNVDFCANYANWIEETEWESVMEFCPDDDNGIYSPPEGEKIYIQKYYELVEDIGLITNDTRMNLIANENDSLQVVTAPDVYRVVDKKIVWLSGMYTVYVNGASGKDKIVLYRKDYQNSLDVYR